MTTEPNTNKGTGSKKERRKAVDVLALAEYLDAVETEENEQVTRLERV